MEAWALRKLRTAFAVWTLMAGSRCAQAAPPTYHFTDLGTLGGNTSRAHAINASGQIVGYSFTGTDPINAHAFLYQNGTMLDLGKPAGGYSAARGINDGGIIVGDTETTTGTPHGFIYAG